jgi:hypothetical protein
MKVKSGHAFLFAYAGLVAVILGRRPGESTDRSPQAAVAPLEEGWPATVPLRLFAKREIAREVIAGERSFLESAALFRELNRLPPRLPNLCPGDPVMGAVRAGSPDDEEQLCGQVISWVRASPTDEVPRREAVVARLEAEFRALLQDQGTIRLPDARSVTPVQDLLARARNALTRAEWEACLGRPDAGGEQP